MFDHLRRDDALKFEIGWNVFDASNKDFSPGAARDRSDFGRKFGPKPTIKERPGFVEQIAASATDFQKLAAGEPAIIEIFEEPPERRPEGRFLRRVTSVPITGRAAFIIGRLAINLLHGVD